VSGSNGTISTGHAVVIGEKVLLLGASTREGDSGSPYLMILGQERSPSRGDSGECDKRSHGNAVLPQKLLRT